MKKQTKIYLKNTVFKLITVINRVIPKNDRLVLMYITSYGLRHNLKPLFEYMIKNGFNKKYSIICCVGGKKYFGEDVHNVKYTTRLFGILYFLRAGHVFYTVGQLPIKPTSKQIVIHMNHGTTDYKLMGALSNSNYGDELFFTYINAPSEFYKPIVAQEYKCSEDCVWITNEPMTDAFFEPIREEYHFEAYKKVLLWLPTFRQSSGLEQSDSSLSKPLILFDKEDYITLNNALKEKNYKMIVKLHTAQVLHDYERVEMSHLTIVSSEEFMEERHDLYQLLKQIDVLIGDYSSVSLQFLLLDKPLAFVIPDIEEYGKTRGFVFDNPEEYMPGYHIKTKEEFFDFLNQLSSDSDPYEEDRQRVCNIVHKYKDGNACQRILKISQMEK